MKFAQLLTVLALSTSGASFAADKHDHDHGHEHKPMHGGVVVEVKDMDYELVVKPDVLQLYLRDHGKPADISKTSAKLTLLSGSDKQEVELKPAGDKLEAKGSFKTTASTKDELHYFLGRSDSDIGIILYAEHQEHICEPHHAQTYLPVRFCGLLDALQRISVHIYDIIEEVNRFSDSLSQALPIYLFLVYHLGQVHRPEVAAFIRQ